MSAGEQEELRRPRRENARLNARLNVRLKEDNEILRRAAAYFSREPTR